jgi:hypothetical protein
MEPRNSTKGDLTMYPQNTFTRIAYFLLLTAFVIALTQFWSIPMKHILAGIVTLVLYGMLLVVYLLRFALIFFSVFAVYRILRERNNKKFAV